jgi:hypothetical protein
MRRVVGLPPSRRETTLAVDEFSYLPVTRDTARVRLRGQWQAPAGATMPAPLLVVDPGHADHRIAPLDRGFAYPTGGLETPSSWRTTYLVPLDAFAQQGGFAVRLPGVAMWPLPAPVSERLPDERAEPAQVEADVVNKTLLELDAALASETAPTETLRAPLDVARGAAHAVGFKLAVQHDQIAELGAELDRSRATAQTREGELSAALDRADQRATAAETHAALATGDVFALRDRLSELERREADLVLRLSGAHTRALEAERARAALEARVAELAAHIGQLEHEVAEHARLALDPRANGGAERARAALEARASKLEQRIAELTRQSAELVGAA